MRAGSPSMEDDGNNDASGDNLGWVAYEYGLGAMYHWSLVKRGSLHALLVSFEARMISSSHCSCVGLWQGHGSEQDGVIHGWQGGQENTSISYTLTHTLLDMHGPASTDTRVKHVRDRCGCSMCVWEQEGSTRSFRIPAHVDLTEQGEASLDDPTQDVRPTKS